MSGEKVGTWCIVDGSGEGGHTFEQASKILEKYQEKSEELRKELMALAKGQPELSISYLEKESESAPPQTVEALVEALNSVQARHNERFFELQRVKQAIQAIERQQRIKENEAEETELRVKILDAVKKLVPGVEPAAAAAIEAMAVEAASPEGNNLETLYDEIKQAVNAANDAVRTKEEERGRHARKHARKATEIVTSLILAGAKDDAEILSDLKKVQCGELALTQALEDKANGEIERLEKARPAERKAADRVKAAEILRDALQELGYVRQPDFFTTEVRFDDGEWRREGYFGRVMINPETQEIAFHMACEEGRGGNLDRDKAVEEQWCQKFTCLKAKLAEKKMEINLSRHVPAGKEQIERVQVKKRVSGGVRDAKSIAQ